MAKSSSGACPICNTNSILTQDHDIHKGYLERVTCPRCGEYLITSRAKDTIASALSMGEAQNKVYMAYKGHITPQVAVYIAVAKKGDESQSIISHVLRRKVEHEAIIDYDDLVNILENNSMPPPIQLAYHFILFLGDKHPNIGDHFTIPTSEEGIQDICGFIGTKLDNGSELRFIISELNKEDIIEIQSNDTVLRLTLSGREKYAKLKGEETNTKTRIGF